MPEIEAASACSLFLVGLCPHDLFGNTGKNKYDEPCPKIHSVQLKRQYEEKAEAAYIYRADIGVRLHELIVELHNDIAASLKLLDCTDAENAIETSVSNVTRTHEVHILSEAIRHKLKEADVFDVEVEKDMKIQLLEEVTELRTKRTHIQSMLLLKAFARQNRRSKNPGEEGTVDEAQKGFKESEVLNKPPEGHEPVLSSSEKTAVDVQITAQKERRLCDVCGAFFIDHNSYCCLADHLGGKLHSGYMDVRDMLSELQIDHIYCPETKLVVHKFLRSRYLTEFEELCPLGGGGSGTVVKCTNRIDKKVYAVKKIILIDSSYEKLVREVDILASLEHPNIVRYYKAWLEPSYHGFYFKDEELNSVFPRNLPNAANTQCLYIQMECCSRTLSNLLDKKISNAKSWKIFLQIVRALAYIHEQGIVHRDLTLANIFVNNDLTIKIGDFGLAKRVGAGSVDSISDGLPYYLAPERKQGEQWVTTKADIYSLGVVAGELLNRFEDPFKRQHALTALSNNGQVPTCWIAERSLILRLLNENPIERPRAEDLIDYAELKTSEEAEKLRTKKRHNKKPRRTV